MQKDCILNAIIPFSVPTQISDSRSLFMQKRAGLAILASGITSAIINGIHYSPSTGVTVSGFGSSSSGSTIYANATSVGSLAFTASITHSVMHIIETVISGVTFYMISACDRSSTLAVTSGWYLASDSYAVTSYTATTHSNTTVDGIASTAGMYKGQLVSKSDIPANTRIASVDSANAITITQAATGSTTSTLTKTPVALIIDANFPTRITGSFAELDGRVFILTQSGDIYQSNTNDVATYKADGYLASNFVTDKGIGLSRIKNNIVAFGTDSAEVFFNNGNSSGSVLSRIAEASFGIGATRSSSSPFFNSFIAFDQYRIAWIAPFGNDSGGVYLMDSNGMKKIGSDVINKFLSANIPRVSVSLISMMGQSFVQISTAIAGADNLLYSIENELWVNAKYPDQFMSSGANGVVVFGCMTLTTGDIYQNSSSTEGSSYQDVGVAFSMTIQTENKYLNSGLPFIIDNINLLADTQSSGSTTLTTSANDYSSFGTVGSFDLTQLQKNLSGGGYYDACVAFKLTDSGNNAWRGQALVIDWRPA